MPARLLARIRSLFRGIRGGARTNAEMHDEFRAHMELRAADLIRSGLSRDAAERQARVEFGSTDHYVDRGREQRGLATVDRIGVSLLDFKLGARMLAKYPGLTIIGGFAIAFAVAIGAATFEFIKQIGAPTIPLPHGDRIVVFRFTDANERLEAHLAYDLARWRTMKSVELVGTYVPYERNLVSADAGEPITVAAISTSVFRLTDVRPILGRILAEDDEQLDAPPVAVIGFDIWKSRFGGDSSIIGRVVRLGADQTTIVGVMPQNYAFPNRQDLWTPLRPDPHTYRRGQGPAFSQAFGRLAPGATLAQARAELATLDAQATAESPTQTPLRTRLIPFGQHMLSFSPSELAMLWSINLFLGMLLVLIFANVALLLFARAASREAEIVVRSALGASRRRIVMQLVAEALVLAAAGATVGLVAATFALRWGLSVVQAELGVRLPFWIQGSLSPLAYVYAIALMLIAALVSGVLPALKVTSAGMDARLRRLGAGGGGLKFGGIWTAVIVVQVAVTVGFPAMVFLMYREIDEQASMKIGVETTQFLTAAIDLDRAASDTSAVFRAHFAAVYGDFRRRLLAETGVSGVALANRMPRTSHPARLVELDSGGGGALDPRWPAYRVSSATVDVDFFGVLGVHPIDGRSFQLPDATSDHHVVVVNESFVQHVLGGRNPIGRRVRYIKFEEREIDHPTEWYEIVGVVPDLGTSTSEDPKVSAIYHSAAPVALLPASIAVRVVGDPATFAPRLRAIAAATDPSLRVRRIVRLDQVDRGDKEFLAFWFRLLISVSAVALVLSLAGIYSVMSFTVARRTREIGVRVALGADGISIVRSIFKRPLRQVGSGVVLGGLLASALVASGQGVWPPTPLQVLTMLGYSCLMMAVCFVACVSPTRRALSIEPTEALKSE